jgi:predicted metal-dependent peptidase
VVASGRDTPQQTPAHHARSWFVSSFPLLGALAASFQIVYDVVACRSLDIRIAAIDPSAQVIYLNPAANLSTEELRFVVAHELLHAGLRHDLRRQGRDAFLWNVACDYVINGWLQEMGVGHMPSVVLYDPELQGLSAEAIYERIVNDLRRARKLATLRGQGVGDILEAPPAWWSGDGCDLDAFYRRCLATGLDLHQSSGRGYLPAGLIQEIEALAHPPVPWDVELAQWFDRYFSPLERYRSFAHPSRRQSSTPDLPRPRYVLREDALDGRTFGVVLDTSGSMGMELLAKALGAIASYAMAREVPAARVIFCDAHPYDQGYLPVEAIASRVKVRGRGGTVLQPGIDLLERACDFPAQGPILVITDAECDVLHIRHEHAFLLPQAGRLPFTPRGPVFRVEP